VSRAQGRGQRLLLRKTEGDAGSQRVRIPARDKCWQHRLVSPWRDAEKVDDWDLGLECLAQPPIVCGVPGATHECVIDQFVAVENLAVHFALIVIPDAIAGLWEDGVDR